MPTEESGAVNLAEVVDDSDTGSVSVIAHNHAVHTSSGIGSGPGIGTDIGSINEFLMESHRRVNCTCAVVMPVLVLIFIAAALVLDSFALTGMFGREATTYCMRVCVLKFPFCQGTKMKFS